MSKELISTIYNQLLQWCISSLPGILIILVITIILFKIKKFFINKIRNLMINRMIKTKQNVLKSEIEKRVETLTGIISSLINISIYITAIMLILRQIGIDITPIIAGAGILGLAIGIGSQALVKDLISGFFMLLENQIRIGDIATINSFSGTVEHVGLRTTILRDVAGVVHVVQNGSITSISNMTKGWSAAILNIGIPYTEDVDRVISIMKEVGEELSLSDDFGHKIINPIEVFGLDDFGDSAVVIKARIKTNPMDQWSIGREYKRLLKLSFDKHGIEIPFPQRTIHVKEVKK